MENAAEPQALDITARAQAIRAGSRAAVANALAELEATRTRPETRALVDALYPSPRQPGAVIGLTGPPGVGKSTLASKLVAAWRSAGRTVGVMAVDPSSRGSGGALLGDRTRIRPAADDDGVFVRSLAARGALGGLSPAAFEAMVVLRAAFDMVLVETVGVGQSETDIARVADVTVVAVQPGSGDTLQFIKSGLMESFELLVVTKSDLGAPARRAHKDLKVALSLLGRSDVEVVLASGTDGSGVEPLVAAIDAVRPAGQDAVRARAEQLTAFATAAATRLFGTLAIARVGGRRALQAKLAASAPAGPYDALARCEEWLT